MENFDKGSLCLEFLFVSNCNYGSFLVGLDSIALARETISSCLSGSKLQRQLHSLFFEPKLE